VQLLLVFLAVGALSVLASNQRLLEAGRFFQLAQLVGSGLVFLALGAAMGPHALGALSAGDLAELDPLLALGLGVAGLMLGLSLDLRVLRLLPGPVYRAALSQSGMAFLVVTAPIGVALFASSPLSAFDAIGAAALLGAAASVSSGHLAVLWYRAGRLDRARGLSVSLLAMLDDLTGILVLAVALVFGASTDAARGLLLLTFAAGIGLICGALIAFLAHGLSEGAELIAILIGGVALVAGAAAYLKVSVLISGLCCGAMLALIGGETVERIFRVLMHIERPVYLLLLFLIGAHVDVRTGLAWLILPSFVVLRFLGKVLGGRLAARFSGGMLSLPPRPGYALLAQGAVSLCVLTDFLLLNPKPTSSLVLAVGAMAALVNEVLAGRMFHFSLLDKRRQPDAPAAGQA
jgi:hypothetical protein